MEKNSWELTDYGNLHSSEKEVGKIADVRIFICDDMYLC
mgnify:CR=1 FL=1